MTTDLFLFANFPINDYSNQVFYNPYNQETRDKDFDKFIAKKFKDISSIDQSKRYIKLPLKYYVGNKYNYGYFIQEGKRYYIFIDSVEWNTNGTSCTLHFSYDYWQTYCYDIEFDESFVEREHVEYDGFGEHIVDEGLPIDEYKVSQNELLKGTNKDLGWYYCVTISDTNQILSPTPETSNPLPTVCQPSKFELSTTILFSDDLSNVTSFLNKLVEKNKIDSIGGLYAVPQVAMQNVTTHEAYYLDGGSADMDYVGKNTKLPSMYKYSKAVSRFFGSDAYNKNMPENNNTKYQPRNSKALTYPYQFINITNNNGSNIVGQFELGSGEEDNKTIKFHYYFPCIEGNTSYGYLADYDGVSKNFDRSLQGQTNPELPYITNTFSAYLSANQNSIANQYDMIDRNLDYSNRRNDFNGIMSGVGAATNLLSGNFLGAAVGGVQAYGNWALGKEGNQLGATNQRKAIDSSLADMRSKGNIAHGSFMGTSCVTSGQWGFKAQLYQVTNENIRMIDDYFTMFGYKVNIIKRPQFMSRKYWNYIKTSGVNVIGNVPQDALNVIKNMFDEGTTIWHKVKYMYKYEKYKDGNSIWYDKNAK